MINVLEVIKDRLSIPNTTAFDNWTTFVDELGTGSRVEPPEKFFRTDGTLQVQLGLGSVETASGDGTARYPFTGVDLRFHSDGSPVDLSSYQGVWLSYQAEGPVDLLLSSAGIDSAAAFRARLQSSKTFEPRFSPGPRFSNPRGLESLLASTPARC